MSDFTSFRHLYISYYDLTYLARSLTRKTVLSVRTGYATETLKTLETLGKSVKSSAESRTTI